MKKSREDLPLLYLVERMVTSDLPDQLLAKETAFETLLFIAALECCKSRQRIRSSHILHSSAPIGNPGQIL